MRLIRQGCPRRRVVKGKFMVRKVLISGASIAGPTAGLVLARHGIETTVVEKAGALRGGGYPIDIRRIALEVANRLGLLDRLRPCVIDMRGWPFVNMWE